LTSNQIVTKILTCQDFGMLKFWYQSKQALIIWNRGSIFRNTEFTVNRNSSNLRSICFLPLPRSSFLSFPFLSTDRDPGHKLLPPPARVPAADSSPTATPLLNFCYLKILCLIFSRQNFFSLQNCFYKKFLKSENEKKVTKKGKKTVGRSTVGSPSLRSTVN